MLGQYQYSTVFQRNVLIETIKADRFVLAHQLTGVPTKLPLPASTAEVQDKNFEGTPWLYHGILDHRLQEDSQLEFHLD